MQGKIVDKKGDCVNRVLAVDLSTLSTITGKEISHNIHRTAIYYRRKRKFLVCVWLRYPQVWIVLWITKDCLLIS